MRTYRFTPFVLAALGLALTSACDKGGSDPDDPGQEATDSADRTADPGPDPAEGTTQTDADMGDEAAPEWENDHAATSEVIWLCIEGMV